MTAYTTQTQSVYYKLNKVVSVMRIISLSLPFYADAKSQLFMSYVCLTLCTPYLNVHKAKIVRLNAPAWECIVLYGIHLPLSLSVDVEVIDDVGVSLVVTKTEHANAINIIIIIIIYSFSISEQ